MERTESKCFVKAQSQRGLLFNDNDGDSNLEKYRVRCLIQR